MSAGIATYREVLRTGRTSRERPQSTNIETDRSDTPRTVLKALARSRRSPAWRKRPEQRPIAWLLGELPIDQDESEQSAEHHGASSHSVGLRLPEHSVIFRPWAETDDRRSVGCAGADNREPWMQMMQTIHDMQARRPRQSVAPQCRASRVTPGAVQIPRIGLGPRLHVARWFTQFEPHTIGIPANASCGLIAGGCTDQRADEEGGTHACCAIRGPAIRQDRKSDCDGQSASQSRCISSPGPTPGRTLHTNRRTERGGSRQLPHPKIGGQQKKTQQSVVDENEGEVAGPK